MTSFTTFPASTRNLTLEKTIEKLRASPRVSACLLLGSSAGSVSEWSDYDLLVVGEFSEAFAVEFSYVDGRPTDLILIETSEFERLIGQDQPSAPSECEVLSWISEARVGFSRLPDLQDLKATAAAMLTKTSVFEEEIFCRWVEANHILLKVNRYLTARDDSYRDGLEILIAKAIAALPQDFLTARGIRWLGDKDAMKNVRANDPEFANSVLRALQSQNLPEKCSLYDTLVARAFAPVGKPWAADESAGGWFRFEGGATDRSAWESLMSQP